MNTQLSDPYADKCVWFLTGSQDLYGEETLAQVEAQSRKIAVRLDAAGEVLKQAWHGSRS